MAKTIIENIKEIVDIYLNGMPASAYNKFKRFMKEHKLKFTFDEISVDNLYRARVSEFELSKPEEMFHVPYNECYKVSNSRYSIAGYPSLYLGEDIDTCINEIAKHYDLSKNVKLYISKITVNKTPENYRTKQIKLKVIDATKKESPLIELFNELNKNITNDVENGKINFNKTYIIPQLFMQWIRNNIKEEEGTIKHIYGIKYKSEIGAGYNFVFPTNREKGKRFCPYLRRLFYVSKPIMIEKCEASNKIQQLLDGIKMEEIPKI